LGIEFFELIDSVSSIVIYLVCLLPILLRIGGGGIFELKLFIIGGGGIVLTVGGLIGVALLSIYTASLDE
jgi:hypothetical protein